MARTPPAAPGPKEHQMKPGVTTRMPHSTPSTPVRLVGVRFSTIWVWTYRCPYRDWDRGNVVNRELLGIIAFRRIIIMRSVSALASWGVILTSSYLVLQVTADPLAVGILALAKGLPSLLLTSYGGSLADRHSMTRVIAITYAVRALAIGALALSFWLGGAGLVAIYATTLIAGCSTALAQASIAALVVQPVPPQLRHRAMVLTSLTYSVGAIIGPVFAGTLLVTVGIGASFFVSALALLGVAGLALLGLGAEYHEGAGHEQESDQPEAESETSWWGNLREGLADKKLRPTFWRIGLLAIAALPVLSLAAVIADQYGNSPILLEVILAASGVGSLLCNLILMKVDLGQVDRNRLIAGSFLVTAVGTVLAAAAPNIAIEALAFALLAASINVIWVATSSAVQTDCTASSRGRMNGIFYTIASAGTSIGALLLAESFKLAGVPTSLLAVSVFLFLVGVFTALRRSSPES